MSNTKRHLSEEAFEILGEQFRAFSEPMRLKLVYALMDGEKTVSELVEQTGGLQANVSKHLRMLLEARIVERRVVVASQQVYVLVAQRGKTLDILVGDLKPFVM